MKKYIMVLTVFGLTAGLSLKAIDQSFINRVKFLQGKASLGAAARKGARYGAQVGAVYGVAKTLPHVPELTKEVGAAGGSKAAGMASAGVATGLMAGVGAAEGAAVGAGVAASAAALKRKWIQYSINQALHHFTAFDFQKLGANQAAMVYAAYSRNLDAMQQAMMLPGVMAFLTKNGVWQALATLYFGETTADRVTQLMQALNFPTEAMTAL